MLFIHQWRLPNAAIYVFIEMTDARKIDRCFTTYKIIQTIFPKTSTINYQNHCGIICVVWC